MLTEYDRSELGAWEMFPVESCQGILEQQTGILI